MAFSGTASAKRRNVLFRRGDCAWTLPDVPSEACVVVVAVAVAVAAVVCGSTVSVAGAAGCDCKGMHTVTTDTERMENTVVRSISPERLYVKQTAGEESFSV